MEAENNSPAERENFLEITVTDIMRQMGVPAHLKGYHYLRYALILCIENSEMITSMGKLLYPAVAKEFNTTSSRVISNIDRAIETSWERGDPELLRLYFGNRGKPSAAQFIVTIADTLRIQFKKKNFNGRF